jgi:cytochrome c oxidase assembly factor CtaG
VVYLACGYLLFLVLLGGEPIRWRPSGFGRFLLLLAAMPADIATGAALMLHPGFAGYPTADVRAGGLVMLAGGDLIMTAVAIAIAVPLVGGERRDHGHRGEAASADLAPYNASLAQLAESGLTRSGLTPSGSPDRRRSPGPPRAGRRPRRSPP